MKKIHYMIKNCKPYCGQKGECLATPDIEDVTCKKCQNKLILDSNADIIEDNKPVCYMTGRMADLDNLSSVVSQLLIENNMVEEAYKMHQLVNKCQYLDDVFMVFEQFVTLK